VSPSSLAERLPDGFAQLRELVAGTGRIDRNAANAIADAVGGSADFWLRRQANYERALERALAAVPGDEAEVWLETIPAPGMKPRGKLDAQRRSAELRRRLSFFGVGTLAAWHGRYGQERDRTLFRSSTAYHSEEGAVSLWLRQGELEASLADTAVWDPAALKARLPRIRKLSQVRHLERFLPKLRELLAESGVALVVLRAPKECKASGATRLIRPEKAMILLSFRHRSDDNFWFTVFHEIGHLLLHKTKAFVDGDETPENEHEAQANAFARSIIIPETRQSEFQELTANYADITRFAVSIGVAPGLVLGQLQHLGRVPRDRLSFLRRRWSWAQIEAAASSL
jgi:Zn-dependent peptidase ImmA (M78 family)/plasmid maintenance system antidote protein VapI